MRTLKVSHRSVILGVSCFTLAALAGCSPKPSPRGLIPAASVAGPASENASSHNQKISAQIYSAMRKVKVAPTGTAKKSLSTFSVHVNRMGEIQIYVYVKATSPLLKSHLISSGLKKLTSVPQLALYQAWGSPQAIERAAALKGVTQITAPIYALKN